MDLDTVIRQNPETPTRRIEDFVHVLDTEKGTLHTFNDVAAFIWESIAEPRRIGDVVAAVVAEFEVDEETAAADTLALADELVQKNLVLTP